MAKIIISADIHFCKRESLVDDRYPFLLDSIAWVDDLEADVHLDLGDMFNTSSLSAEDVAVLEKLKFKNVWHCVSGNHEQDGQNSLLKYFRDLHMIYERPQLKNFGRDIGWVLFIPYVREPKPLDELLSKLPVGEQVIVCSHCEFVGMFGAKHGYSVADISNDTRIKMWFNGHYHQRMLLSENVIVVGNLLGKNFSQNFDPHGVAVYDTVSNKVEFVENPHALVFGKMDTGNPACRDIRKLIEGDKVRRYVLAIQTEDELKDMIKEWADKYLVASRVVVAGGCGGTGLYDEELEAGNAVTIDHRAMFFNEVRVRYGEGIANAILSN